MMLSIVISLLISITAAKEAPIRLCGRNLANARVLICYGDEIINKRTSEFGHYDPLSDEYLLDETQLWDGRRGALGAGWGRYKRAGLADECCIMGCTSDTIRKYC